MKEYFDTCAKYKKDSPKARIALEKYKAALQSQAEVCEPHTILRSSKPGDAVMPAPAAAQEVRPLAEVKESFKKVVETGVFLKVVETGVGKTFFAPEASAIIQAKKFFAPDVDSAVPIATVVALAALVTIAISLAFLSIRESRR